jgi:uncharacterized membrane protein
MPKWFVYASLSLLMWGAWSLLSPLATRELNASAVQMLSSFGLVPFAAALMLSSGWRDGTNFAKGLGLAIATGVTAGLGNVLLYIALAYGGPASLVFPITSMAPIIPVVLSPVLFRERLRSVQFVGIAIALFAIVCLNMTPQGAFQKHVSIFAEWMLYSLLSLVVFGITFLTQKGATYFISDKLCTIGFTVGFLLLDPFLLLSWQKPRWPIPPSAALISILIGLAMGIGSLTLFAAYRHGKASIVTPYSQLYPVITIFAAIPLYGEHIDVARGIGIAAAIVAGILLSLEKEAGGAAAASTVVS